MPLALTGIGIGIAFSAPLGPVNLLCIRKTMTRGFRAGLLTGLGAATGDAVYAALAVFGVTAVLSFVEENAQIVQAVGGILVIGFGITTLAQTRRAAFVRERPMERYRGFFAGLALTLANPGVLFGFILVASGFSRELVETPGYGNATMLLAGIVSGSLLWWVGLTFLVSRVRTRIDERWFGRVNMTSAAVLILFGAVLLGRAALQIA